MSKSAERYLLSPSMKMADLMNIDFSLLGVLTRMGIPFGFGDRTVEQVCLENGVNPETFLLIAAVYVYSDYKPTREALENADLPGIVAYLRRSHAYYMETVLPVMAASLERMVQPGDARNLQIIKQFFADFKEGLQQHFNYEEKQLFPFVKAALNHRKADAPGAADDELHLDAKEKLQDLKSLVMKYIPAQCDQAEAYKVLSGIYTMEEDFEKHTFIEDEILLPGAGLEGDNLSAREREILVCVAKGMLNKEIADKFSISIYTVITHRKNITRKTGIKTVAGLTVYALLNNLIDKNTVE